MTTYGMNVTMSHLNPSLAERRGSNVEPLQHVGVASLPPNLGGVVIHLQCDTIGASRTHAGDLVNSTSRVRLLSNSLEELKLKGIQQLSEVRLDKHMLSDEKDQLLGRETRDSRISLSGALRPEINMQPITRLPQAAAVQLRAVDHPITPTRVNPTLGGLVPSHVPRIRRFSGSSRLMVLSDSGPKILQALVQNTKIVLPTKTQERLARLRIPSTSTMRVPPTPNVIHEPIQLDPSLVDRTKASYVDNSSFQISRPPRTTSVESLLSISSMNSRTRHLPLKQPFISIPSKSQPDVPLEELAAVPRGVFPSDMQEEMSVSRVVLIDKARIIEERSKRSVDQVSLSWFMRMFCHAVSSNIDYCNHLMDVNTYQCIDSMLYDGSPLLPGASDVHISTWWKHLVAGGLAGAVSRTATAPLDRVKVMRMVLGSRLSNVGLPKMLQCMLKEGGAQSLWRGNAMNVVKVVPETALKFAIYEQIKNSMRSGRTYELGVKERFIAGSMAGLLSQTVIYPLEVLKTQMVLRRTGQYSGVADCIRQMFRTNGVGAFYRGYLPNVLGIMPYSGIDLAIYETLKRWYMSKQSVVGTEPGTLVLLACALTSSTCGQLASYPLSLVRTRLQAQATLNGGPLAAGMVSEFRCIYKSDGLTGLYRGLAANFLKVAPAVAISYIVYENVRTTLGVKMT